MPQQLQPAEHASHHRTRCRCGRPAGPTQALPLMVLPLLLEVEVATLLLLALLPAEGDAGAGSCHYFSHCPQLPPVAQQLKQAHTPQDPTQLAVGPHQHPSRGSSRTVSCNALRLTHTLCALHVQCASCHAPRPAILISAASTKNGLGCGKARRQPVSKHNLLSVACAHLTRPCKHVQCACAHASMPSIIPPCILPMPAFYHCSCLSLYKRAALLACSCHPSAASPASEGPTTPMCAHAQARTCP